MANASSCVPSGPEEFSSRLSVKAQETFIEEASKFTGTPIPVPGYLPEGCKIQEVFIQPFSENPSGSPITLLISDKKIDKEITTYTDSAGRTHQRYEFKCKMKMSGCWYWGFDGFKPPCSGKSCKRVNIRRDGEGWLFERDTYNCLVWRPAGDDLPGFEISLSAGKGIPKKELLKVAERTYYTRHSPPIGE